MKDKVNAIKRFDTELSHSFTIFVLCSNLALVLDIVKMNPIMNKIITYCTSHKSLTHDV